MVSSRTEATPQRGRAGAGFQAALGLVVPSKPTSGDCSRSLPTAEVGLKLQEVQSSTVA